MHQSYLKVIVVLFFTTVASTTIDAQPTISIRVFYDELSPYGVWVEDPQYGHVWVPDVTTGFQPYYTNGYWVMTEYGNTWVSGYPWGWATFHYGRWQYDAFYGWIWVPGYDWAPAWVYWRYGAGYYGWAPLTPGFTVSVSFGVYNCPMDWWVFLPPQYLYRKSFTHHVRDRRNNLNIHNQTTVINNTYINSTRNTTYITGPTRTEYMQVSGRNVPEYKLKNTSTRNSTYVRNNTLRIYKPEIKRDDNAPAPSRAIRATRPVSEPVPVSTNKNRPAPFAREIEKSRVIRTVPARTPVQPAPQRTPSQRTPVRREPVQRTPQRTTTPTRREPVQRAPQRAEPVKRAEPVQQKQSERQPGRSR